MMIYAERYKQLGDPDRKTINEINDIMNNSVEGWKSGPNHRFGVPYGNQRSWMRENMIAPDLASEGFVPMTPEQLAFELPPNWKE